MDFAAEEEPEYTEEEVRLLAMYRAPLKPSVRAHAPSSAVSEPVDTGGTSSAAGLKRPRLKIVGQGISGANEVDGLLGDSYDERYVVWSSDWDSRKVDESSPLQVELPDVSLDSFDADSSSRQVMDERAAEGKRNTVVAVLTMPFESDRFSLFLGREEPVDVSSSTAPCVYRFIAKDSAGRQSIVQTSLKKGQEGGASSESDRTVKGFPIVKQKRFELKLVLCVPGIAVFLNNRLVSEYPYSGEHPQPGQSLWFAVPVLGEENSKAREKVIIHKIWWGYSSPLVDSRKVPFMGGDSQEERTGIAERCVVVSGLPKDGTAESELVRIFEHYQVETKGAKQCVSVDSHTGTGAVMFQSAFHVGKAIDYLSNTITPSGDRLHVKQALKKQVPGWFLM